jgi:purine/pyrimidine-nucleoside phosphorylase
MWPIKMFGYPGASRRPVLFPDPHMTTSRIDGVAVTTQASVYFDGKCVSHGITYPDGTKKSVGVVLPATLTFNTGAPEIMECVAGSCEYRLAGTDAWLKSAPGEKFSVPGSSSFDIRVTEPYHYICHFG